MNIYSDEHTYDACPKYSQLGSVRIICIFYSIFYTHIRSKFKESWQFFFDIFSSPFQNLHFPFKMQSERKEVSWDGL